MDRIMESSGIPRNSNGPTTVPVDLRYDPVPSKWAMETISEYRSSEERAPEIETSQRGENSMVVTAPTVSPRLRRDGLSRASPSTMSARITEELSTNSRLSRPTTFSPLTVTSYPAWA